MYRLWTLSLFSLFALSACNLEKADQCFLEYIGPDDPDTYYIPNEAIDPKNPIVVDGSKYFRGTDKHPLKRVEMPEKPSLVGAIHVTQTSMGLYRLSNEVPSMPFTVPAELEGRNDCDRKPAIAHLKLTFGFPKSFIEQELAKQALGLALNNELATAEAPTPSRSRSGGSFVPQPVQQLTSYFGFTPRR